MKNATLTPSRTSLNGNGAHILNRKAIKLLGEIGKKNVILREEREREADEKYQWVRKIDDSGVPLLGIAYNQDGQLCRVLINTGEAQEEEIHLCDALEVLAFINSAEEHLGCATTCNTDAVTRFYNHLRAALPPN